ncbi:hypothetical protein BGW37DRAFT_491863 [Umbelopsis sp. PMI_123]|nr:hypothetical protein BGW37DRAFT_491863 [Umbelopsis sp. PMI_123]
MVSGWRNNAFFRSYRSDDSSTFSTIFLTFFAAVYSSGVFYIFYTIVIAVDIALHRAPTNCTILSAASGSENWSIHVTYPIPGQSENSTALLENTNRNDMYTVNQTLSCFYSTRSFRSVVQYDNGVDSSLILALIASCMMGILGIAGALYVTWVAINVLLPVFELIWLVTSIFVKPVMIPIKYSVGGIRTWLQPHKSQQKELYDMDEQAAFLSQGHSTEEDEEFEKEK